MKIARIILFCVAMLGLTGGYLASQFAYLNGNAKDYAASVDTPAIQVISLLLLIVCIALPFIKVKEEEE